MYARTLGPGAQLRPLEPWHWQEFLANLDRARTHVSPWVGRSFLATDQESAEAVLRRYWDARALGGGGVHGIWLDGVLVGGVMVVSLDTSTGVSEVGCWLEPAAEGRGLITRAAGMLVDWVVRERGIERVEWHTFADNVRSIAVARRLGMALQEVVDPEAADAADAGSDARVLEIWSVAAADWLARRAAADEAEPDVAAIDALTSDFFDAFSNTDGRRVDLTRLTGLFLPGAVIVSHGDPVKAEDLAAFTEPRQRILTNGELTGFREWETDSTTHVSGNVAQRLVRYTKAGVLHGVPFTGSGTKGIQFVRTSDGWRIAGIAGNDDGS
jgi:ribosomal-protein-serine acetyltransferase